MSTYCYVFAHWLKYNIIIIKQIFPFAYMYQPTDQEFTSQP